MFIVLNEGSPSVKRLSIHMHTFHGAHLNFTVDYSG